MINFDPASAVPSFSELHLKKLVESFPSVEDLIVDAEFYSITTPLLSLFHSMFVLRRIQNIETLVQISSMFQPARKYHSVHEKLWLLTMLGADVCELSSLAGTQKSPQARRYLASAQGRRQTRFMPNPQVQIRVNFEPTVAEAIPRQPPTSNIISTTSAVGVQSAICQDQMSHTAG